MGSQAPWSDSASCEATRLVSETNGGDVSPKPPAERHVGVLRSANALDLCALPPRLPQTIGQTPARNSPRTMPSVRASQDASITLGWTPIEPQASTPSLVSRNTRTVAPVDSVESSTRTR